MLASGCARLYRIVLVVLIANAKKKAEKKENNTRSLL